MATLAHFAPLTEDDHHLKLESDTEANRSSAIKKQSESFFVLNTVR